MSQPPYIMTDRTRLVLQLAGAGRHDERQCVATAIDILTALFEQHNSGAMYILDRVGAPVDALASALVEYDQDRELKYSAESAVLANAQLAAERTGSVVVGSEHLLLGVLMCGDAGICEAFETQGIFVHDIIVKAEPILREIAIRELPAR